MAMRKHLYPLCCRCLRDNLSFVMAVGGAGGSIGIRLTSLDHDVAAIISVPDQQHGALVLVGRSYWGIKPSRAGFLLVDRAKFAADFGANLPEDEAEFMAGSQTPVAVAAMPSR
ncbi:Hydrolase protein (fragment) [Agrobacterium tumefaciens str. Kerr 14]|uniref:Hydrolase protein n=1 Tax=Agrobacterium tumefaciens str. Kerr 14 TaxID=1183424 RepID=A0A1S7SBN9_AGRTU